VRSSAATTAAAGDPRWRPVELESWKWDKSESLSPQAAPARYPSHVIYRFGPFELDEKAYTLTRNGQPLRLRPKLFDVLLHLIRHRDRVVTNRELLEAVWGPEHVTPSVVPWTISRLRSALGQQGDRQSPIATIPRRGYRFQEALSIDSAPQKVASEPERAPIAAVCDSSFIGREEGLQTFGAALASAHAGSGGLFLLIGEPGVGRTRCVQEFGRRAKADASVWSAACARTPSTPPFWPWLQILHACAREELEGSVLRQRVEALLAALQNQLDEIADDSVDMRAYALFAQTCDLLVDAACARTRVLLLDDLHDTDKGSLKLLSLLAPRLGDCRLLIVGTLQEISLASERAHAPHLQDVRNQAHCIALAPWSRDEVEAFVSASVAPDQRERVTEAIWRRAQGNPLFAHELLQHYQLHGGAAGELAELELASGSRNLPTTLQNLIRHRLQALPRKTTALLGAASVIGRRFDLPLLQRLTGQPAAALLAALDRAQLLGVVEPGERVADYSFKHELIRDAIYTDLPGQTRARLHLQVGEALEDPAFGSVTPSILAWHFYCAAPLGGASRAVHYAMQAARDARRLAAYTDEVRYREWALEAQALGENPSPAQRCELLVALATARNDLGEVDVARRHLSRAIEIAEAGNLPEPLARAAFILRSSMLLSGMPDPLALHALEHARRDLPEDARGLRGRVASYLASIPPYSQSPDQRQELLDEGLSLARASGDSTSLFDALRARCAALMHPGTLDELLKWANEIDALAERVGSPRMVHESQQYRYIALLQLGRPIEDSNILEKLARSTGKHAQREAKWLHRSLQVRHLLYFGQLQKAAEQFRQLRLESGGVRSWLSDFHYAIGMALIQLERDSAKEYWSEFLDVTQGWQRSSRTLSALSMRMLLAQGRVAEVRSEIERTAVDALIRRPVVSGQLGVLSQLSLVMIELGDRERCAALYERMLPFAQLSAVDEFWFAFGSVAYFLGVLAAACGDGEAARTHLEHSLERNAKLGYRVQAAWTRYELARALLSSKESSQRARALALLSEAEQQARKHDLRVLLRGVQGLDVPALELRAQTARPGRRHPAELQ
jgi:DNA-binding winged helix-turn-helix (wHTH) protein